MDALERYENKLKMLQIDIEYAKNAIRYMISDEARDAGDREMVGKMALNYLERMEVE